MSEYPVMSRREQIKPADSITGIGGFFCWIEPMASRLFLVVKSSDLQGYKNQSDRDFFAVPVEVIPHSCDRNTRMLYVRSPLQNDVVYPVDRHDIKSEFRLTKKQLQSARTI